MATDEPTLYDEVVRITNIYLGPAADRFIARQVQSHLQKRPDRLTKDDLAKLTDWIQVAVALLTDDSEVVEEYIAHLHKLAAPGGQPDGSR